MCEVDFWDGDVLFVYVLPDVHLGPVAEGKHAEVFSVVFSSVVEVPEFWSLVFWIPLSEFVSVGEKSFFGACFFFISPSSADGDIKFVFLDGVEEGDGLEDVPAGVFPGFFFDAAGINAFLHGSDDKVYPSFFEVVVSEGEGFWEVVSSVYVEEGERDGCGLECFLCEVSEGDGVFSS